MGFIFSLLTSLIASLIYLQSSKITSTKTQIAVRGITILIGSIALLASISRLLVIVPPGNVGIVNFFGKVSDNTLDSGVHLVNPFAKVLNFSTRLKDIKENIDTTSQEGLSLNLDVSLQYRLDPQKAALVYKTIGIDEKELIISRFRSTVRAITANYPASAIYSTQRQEIVQKIDQKLTPQITSLGFIVDQALLRNIKMPDTLQTAIQEKLKAEQENEQMKFVLEKERQEAERKRIEAKGVADSQKIISGGLTNQVLQLRAIEATEKLAQSNNSKIVVLGSEKGGMPILIQPDSGTTKP
ncbi:prohibitin family protein [Anabaena cylindrica FACHB-243]|uniref:SPFH domain, Band 7 family protein n=1 Tax=Anabaena cylindrica (strain ATCC 27899 / PCC 7122) TaxID=272123 RepID=K9ZE67_ANACC|nr:MULTISPECIES: prohibitin family protein [Anabaena]AFZ57503.1 SPFH domain, Band 7 family protein [Anabaena cylindrica PCC 7122]MBD2421187.1 prohibitin family protein [Anabaena cylindrica FACHB-243]MBY5281715.1 prohibitin family protein [Anabaena sp. CCAP 1446/1C]MBY5310330.1 prohibitin family protein [Anabaena sp. CCAP 1446/1C]MCM2405945.1 prohibitin family protein [Anabaena sp. CCAP 1446/1C]